MANQLHHRTPRYQYHAPRITATARRNPRAVCASCGRTYDQHPLGANGKPQRWQAGHTIAGSHTWQPWYDVEHVPPPGDWLAPTLSRCNIGDGNRARDASNEPRTLTWQVANIAS